MPPLHIMPLVGVYYERHMGSTGASPTSRPRTPGAWWACCRHAFHSLVPPLQTSFTPSLHWLVFCQMHACVDWEIPDLSLPNTKCTAGLLQATHLAETLSIAAGAVARGRQAT